MIFLPDGGVFYYNTEKKVLELKHYEPVLKIKIVIEFAKALTRIRRWPTVASEDTPTVALHSHALASLFLPPSAQHKAALVHDFAEVFVGDAQGPYAKHMPLRDEIQTAIYRWLGLYEENYQAAEKYDSMAAIIEAFWLMHPAEFAAFNGALTVKPSHLVEKANEYLCALRLYVKHKDLYHEKYLAAVARTVDPLDVTKPRGHTL